MTDSLLENSPVDTVVFCGQLLQTKQPLNMYFRSVRWQQHSFSIHERVFLWKCQSFWDKKVLDLKGIRTPNLLIHGEWSSHLSYQGQTFATPCFWILALAYIYTFEMLTVRCQTHSFSTHERMFLWKCQSFWDRKCPDLRGTRTPDLRIHAELSNPSSSHKVIAWINNNIHCVMWNGFLINVRNLSFFSCRVWRYLLEWTI